MNLTELLTRNLEEHSEEAWENAIIIALSLHKDARVQELAGADRKEQMRELIQQTPLGLIVLVGYCLEVALNSQAPDVDVREAKALRRTLRELFAEQKRVETVPEAPDFLGESGPEKAVM